MLFDLEHQDDLAFPGREAAEDQRFAAPERCCCFQQRPAVVVHFDGEVVLAVEPVLGYLHRGTEKLAEGIRLFAVDAGKLDKLIQEA